MLAKELNISTITVNKLLVEIKDNNILTGEELKNFKQENNLKSSCSLLRIIYANSALEIAKRFGRDIINYFLNASDKYKLPLDLMNVAFKQASELVRIGGK